MLARTFLSGPTTAAAVSSQEVSTPRIGPYCERDEDLAEKWLIASEAAEGECRVLVMKLGRTARGTARLPHAARLNGVVTVATESDGKFCTLFPDRVRLPPSLPVR